MNIKPGKWNLYLNGEQIATMDAEMIPTFENIGNVVKERSKAMGYDIVFNKSAVLYGGEDITSSIQKYIK